MYINAYSLHAGSKYLTTMPTDIQTRIRALPTSAGTRQVLHVVAYQDGTRRPQTELIKNIWCIQIFQQKKRGNQEKYIVITHFAGPTSHKSSKQMPRPPGRHPPKRATCGEGHTGSDTLQSRHWPSLPNTRNACIFPCSQALPNAHAGETTAAPILTVDTGDPGQLSTATAQLSAPAPPGASATSAS